MLLDVLLEAGKIVLDAWVLVDVVSGKARQRAHADKLEGLVERYEQTVNTNAAKELLGISKCLKRGIPG